MHNYLNNSSNPNNSNSILFTSSPRPTTSNDSNANANKQNHDQLSALYETLSSHMSLSYPQGSSVSSDQIQATQNQYQRSESFSDNGSTSSLQSAHRSTDTSSRPSHIIQIIKVPRKRQRLTLVCDNCKRRKIKCDKGQPCTSCIRSNLRSSCHYGTTSASKDDFNQSSISDGTKLFENFDANSSSSNSNTEAKEAQDSDSTKSEIALLKLKIKQLESSQLKTLSSPPSVLKSPRCTISQALPLPHTSYNFQGRQASIDQNSSTTTPFSDTKLPPINWTPRIHDNHNDLNDSDLNNFSKKECRDNTSHLADLQSNDENADNFIDDDHKLSNKASALNIITTSIFSPNFLAGVNPVANTTETINFYSDYSTIHTSDEGRLVNNGPFSWSAMMKRDDGLHLLWDYMLERERMQDLSYCYKPIPVKHEKDRVMEIQAYNHMVDECLAAQNNSNQLIMSDKIQLKSSILANLPPTRIIWQLVDRFFLYLYPVLPFLDQEIFENQLIKIIGVRVSSTTSFETKLHELNIISKVDFAVLGILLLVLRLSFLSIFSNNETANKDLVKLSLSRPGLSLEFDKRQECATTLKYLVKNPISCNLASIADECHTLFQWNETHHYTDLENLTFLQLSFFIRLYNRFAPEDSDGADGGGAQVANAILIQLSYKLGLNREPTKLKKEDDDVVLSKLNHLKRKIWHFAIYADIYHSYTFGMPLSIDKIYYDTQLPFSTAINSNIKNKSLDAKITKFFFKPWDLITSLKDVLNVFLNIEDEIKMIEVSESISNYETLFFNQYLTLEHCLGLDEDIGVNKLYQGLINESNLKEEIIKLDGYDDYRIWLDCTKLNRVKYYLSMNSFFISIYYHIYQFYINKNHNLSFFYLKKTFMFIVEILPYYQILLRLGDFVCDFVVNPTLELSIHKSNQILMSFIIKLNYIIYEMKKISKEEDNSMLRNKNFYQYLNSIENFKNALVMVSKYLIYSVSNLSNRYYYAWRITKAHNAALHAICGEDFYKNTYDNLKLIHLKTPRYSSEQIKELHRILKGAIDKTINTTNNGCCEIYKPNDEVDLKWYNHASENGKRKVCMFDIFSDEL